MENYTLNKAVVRQFNLFHYCASLTLCNARDKGLAQIIIITEAEYI